jgi:hypothetical protein
MGSAFKEVQQEPQPQQSLKKAQPVGGKTAPGIVLGVR